MLWRRRKQSDFNAEIEAHLQLEADHLRNRGMSHHEAEAAARRSLGNATTMMERFNERSSWLSLDHLKLDIAFSFRMLRRSPGFTITAILLLAAGIGVNTAVLNCVDAIFFRRLPVHEPDRLVALLVCAGLLLESLHAVLGRSIFADARIASFRLRPSQIGYTPERAEKLNREMVRRTSALPGVQSTVLGTVAPTRGWGQSSRVQLPEHPRDTRPIQVSSNYVTPGFFATIGIPLVAGCEFDERGRPGAPGAAIVSRTRDDIARAQRDVVSNRGAAGARPYF